jgi:hypothetical protein
MPGNENNNDGSRRRRGLFRGRRRLGNRPVEQPRSEQHQEISRVDTLDDLPRRNEDEQKKLPDGMALLRVYTRESSNGAPCFGFDVHCFCPEGKAEGKIFDNLKYGRPDLAINDNIRAKGPPPGEFLSQLWIWSAQKGELTRWLYEHRSKHGELKLAVWDDTGYRIPWELLWLPPNPGVTGPEPGFLGAVVTVTRQVSTHVAFPETMRTFEDPYLASGPVAAYFAADMASDEALFTDYVVDPVASMEDLFANLATQSEALSMVYVACHGTFSNEPDKFVLGGLPYGRAVQFNYNLLRLREQPALVFLNSCVSGLESVDTGKYNDGAQRGFAEVFLCSGAVGVLATTGAVGNDEARELAGELLKRLKADPELYVAEAVRQLRAQALNEMNKNPQWFLSDLSEDERNAADGELLPLLYPFMYVYFGSPWLLLSPSERQLAVGSGDPDGTRG